MIELTHSPIDTSALLAQVQSNQAGAAVLFLGVTREFTDGRQTVALDYQCYPEMASRKLESLEKTAHAQWDLIACAMIHRLGRVELGEASVAIAVSSAHREAAFEAGKWLIDQLKQEVPIWKKENWADGTSEWVHPGLAPAEKEVRQDD